MIEIYRSGYRFSHLVLFHRIKILVAIDGLNGFWKDANINILRRKKVS